MIKNRKLSIIIPVYNLEKYISKCLNSIVKQVEDDCVEVIMVNDGSTDKSEEICKEYCEKYSYMKYFYQENAGVSAARNYGLHQAVGTYILFIDGDDWLLDDAFNTILTELTGEYDIVMGDFIKCFDDKVEKIYTKNRNLRQEINKMEYPEILINIFKYELYNMSLWCNIIRKELLDDNQIRLDRNINYTEDMDCVLEALLVSRKIKLLSSPIYAYRQDRKNSVTNQFTLKRLLDTMYFVNKWYHRIDNMELEVDLRKYILDFIRYEYFIAVGISTLISEEKNETIMNQLKEYEFLFQDAYGKKQKIVQATYKVLGFNMTSKFMGYWIKNKNKIKK